MKIGITIWNPDVSGGGERQALELAKQLRRMGHQRALFIDCPPGIVAAQQRYVVERIESISARGGRSNGY